MIQGLEILDDLLRETGKADALRAEGEARGEVKGAREALLHLGRKRFGEPDAETLRMLEAIGSTVTLLQMMDRVTENESWNELTASL